MRSIRSASRGPTTTRRLSGIEPHHIERRARGDAEPAPLPDREMHDAPMGADDAAVEIDDIAGFDRIRPQPPDDVGVAPGRHEADVLAVVLVGDLEAEAARELAHLGLRSVAERKAQIVELVARGREQEIALVAIGVGGAEQRPRSVGKTARGDIMAGGERRGAELARGLQKVAELDRAVALDAGHRRLAERVAVGEIVDHRFAEAVLVIQHVMRDADPLGDIAGIVDVLAGAAGALAMGGRAMIVELQRDADDVVAFRLQQRSRHRGIDAARHGDDDPCVLRTAFEVQTVAHGSGH